MDTIAVVLEGGPSDLPPVSRKRTVSAGTKKIKLQHRNGYEHFERCTPDDCQGPLVVFRWSMRTAIAE